MDVYDAIKCGACNSCEHDPVICQLEYGYCKLYGHADDADNTDDEDDSLE